MAELVNEFSWSRSRAGQFDECPRRYWFTYYGAWGGWKTSAPPRVRDAYVLKQLKSRWMWVGELVHDQIAKCLVAARAGELVPLERATEELLTRMRADFRASRAFEYRASPKKACGLLEHEYAKPVTDAEWGEVADHMKTCLAAFYRSPWITKLPTLPRGAWLPIEELSHFRLDGVKVFVKPDFAYKTSDETAEIIDWKTGRREDEPDPIQLACYARYAVEKGWAKSATDVTTNEYNLASGRGRETRMDEQKLAEVESAIRSSVAKMKALLDDPERNVATESKFPVAKDASACRNCNYQRICTDKP